MNGDVRPAADKTFSLQKCSTRAELDVIVACMWRAFEQPFHPWLRIVAPVFGSSPEDYAAALRSHQERCWDEHVLDATSTWLYAADNESKDIVGAAEWKVFKTNPYVTGCQKIEAHCE